MLQQCSVQEKRKNNKRIYIRYTFYWHFTKQIFIFLQICPVSFFCLILYKSTMYMRCVRCRRKTRWRKSIVILNVQIKYTNIMWQYLCILYETMCLSALKNVSWMLLEIYKIHENANPTLWNSSLRKKS